MRTAARVECQSIVVEQGDGIDRHRVGVAQTADEVAVPVQPVPRPGERTRAAAHERAATAADADRQASRASLDAAVNTVLEAVALQAAVVTEYAQVLVLRVSRLPRVELAVARCAAA